MDGKELTPDSMIRNGLLENSEAVMKYFAKGLQYSITHCAPAAVVSYDRGSGVAKVQPLVKWPYMENGEKKFSTMSPIDLRVRRVCAGGFSIDVPLFVGDTGWMISSNVDTTLVRQNGNAVCNVLEKDVDLTEVQEGFPQNPNTMICHCFEHGYFLPDCWAAFDVKSIRNLDGKVGEKDLYIGESAPGTCSVDEDGKSSTSGEKDGLASITISRGEDKSIKLSIGNETGIVIKKDGEIEIKASKVKIEGETMTFQGGLADFKTESVQLPDNTTVGGRSFSEQAFNG